MGGTDSKNKIEEEFEIFKIEKDGNALLKSKADSKEYLMRVVACSSQADIDRLKALLECRAQLKSHHLLTLVQIKEKQQDLICSIHFKMYLVLQYSFKNAAQQIKERSASTIDSHFQESDIWSIIYSCCTALNVLYSNGATHQSITSEQIFINKDGFVKMSQPLLFGLQKNHLDAMRTKDEDTIAVHLSPQIMSCLDDQNFFYYDKEKSDIFILGMIIVDIALLSFNYLYDPIKRKSKQTIIPSLLSKISDRYSPNLVSILQEMLKIEAKERPGFSQIIQRVEKCNNIGEEFTVETESNVKSNQMVIQKSKRQVQQQEKLSNFNEFPVTPVKNTMEIHVPERKRQRQIVSSNIFYARAYPDIKYHQQQAKEEPVYQQIPNKNTQQSAFDSSNHHKQPIQYNNVKVITNNYAQNQINVQSHEKIHTVYTSNHPQTIHHLNSHPHLQNNPAQNIIYRQVERSNPLSQAHQHQTVFIKSQQPPTNVTHQQHQAAALSQSNPAFHVMNPHHFQSPPNQNYKNSHATVSQKVNSFNIYERSKSIDSIKINNQLNKFQPLKQKYTEPASKNYASYDKNGYSGSANSHLSSFNFNTQTKGDNQLFTSFNTKAGLQGKVKKKEPIFTHQIPEVYNLLVKKTNLPFKTEDFTYKEKQKQKISQVNPYAQENHQFSKFNNFKQLPYETISRVSEEQQSNATFQNVELTKNISQTHSQNNHLAQRVRNADPNESAKQNYFKNSLANSPVKAAYPNNFGLISQASSNYLIKTPNVKSEMIDEIKNNKHLVSSNFISNNFISSDPKPFKQPPSYTSNFYKHNKDLANLNLEFTKEVIPGKGTYQGYKYDNQKHGNGILYFQDGGHYEGEWKNDKMNGFGRLYYENGKIAYEGHWENDQFNGQGRVYNSEPATFQGEFNYKDFSQLGNNWIYYEGQFKNDSKHGKGYIKLTNGETFEGLFDNDMIEGNGIFYKSTGQIILGFWIDNKLFLNQSYEQDKK